MPETRHSIPSKPLFSPLELALSRVRRETWIGGVDGKFVTSGRAAIFHALKLVGVKAGDSVLVPDYHCSTLIAPVVRLGAIPVFYATLETGLPDLVDLDREGRGAAKAMIVPHLFGVPNDLNSVRSWCDARGMKLIEDCAHAIFGRAGARWVGEWGDYATASLTKFLPVDELGWLYSATLGVPDLQLKRNSTVSELRGFIDPIHLASEYRRLGLIGSAVRALFDFRRSIVKEVRFLESRPNDSAETGAADVEPVLAASGMARVQRSPKLAPRILASLSDLDIIFTRRRRNLFRMIGLFNRVGIGRLLWDAIPEDCAPYVLPVIFVDAERSYRLMREHGFPVYRWDRLWPGALSCSGGVAERWSTQLFQIPVHQSYLDDDLRKMEEILSAIGKA